MIGTKQEASFDLLLLVDVNKSYDIQENKLNLALMHLPCSNMGVANLSQFAKKKYKERKILELAHKGCQKYSLSLDHIRNNELMVLCI